MTSSSAKPEDRCCDQGAFGRLAAEADRSFAVDDVSLKIYPREILCVVGESGSGKSVTSFAIMGLLDSALKPVQGEIWFEGQNLLKMLRANCGRCAAIACR